PIRWTTSMDRPEIRRRGRPPSGGQSEASAGVAGCGAGSGAEVGRVLRVHVLRRAATGRGAAPGGGRVRTTGEGKGVGCTSRDQRNTSARTGARVTRCVRTGN